MLPGQRTGIVLTFGTEAQGRAAVGLRRPPRTPAGPVSAYQVSLFCAAVGETTYAGSDLAPPGMLMAWQMSPASADGPGEQPLLAQEVPLPGDDLINALTDTTFLAPVRIGDQLTIEEEVTEVSGERPTALGPGHFVTSVTTFTNQAGELVARNRNVLLRFTHAPAQTTRTAEPEPEGEPLPTVHLELTLRRLVMGAGGSGDFFPGHHDDAFARTQGVAGVYANTMFLHGLVDRVVREAHPGATLRSRSLRMLAPLTLGRIEVAARVLDRPGDALEAAVDVRDERGAVCATSRQSWDL